MARQTKTPGETTPVEEVKTTDQQADEALEAILGPSKDDQSTSETSAASEPVEETQTVNNDDVLDALLAISNRQISIENKLDQLLSAGGIETAKKKRWVQGKNGLEHKEIS